MEVGKLFYLGEWDEHIFDRCVAIVGSRRMTSYGERMIERIVPELVEAGVTIISGFMYGVDQKAHQVCIECGGRTVAVLGWGIEYKHDKYLNVGPQGGIGYQKIIDGGGLVISEWEKEVSARWMFAYRNRIIASLSQAVLVVEAAEKSGSLITAKWAEKLGRKLLAVPGPATSSVTEGTNELIKSGRAEMVRSGGDVLAALNFNFKESIHALDENDKLIKLLNAEPLTVDELAKKLKKPVEKINAELGLLELNGEVLVREGKYYVDQS